MNIRPDLIMTREAFKAWVARQETKHEWVKGRVTMMIRVSNYHARILRNVMAALIARLDLDKWDIQAEAFGVEMSESLRYPDLLVEPLQQTKSYDAAKPILIVEIQSSSTTKTDMIEKPAEYFERASLETYLVLNQDEPIAWVWQRRADGSVPASPEEIVGRSATVPVPGLGLDLPMAELYRGLPDAG